MQNKSQTPAAAFLDLPRPYLRLDASGRLLSYNRAFEREFGARETELELTAWWSAPAQWRDAVADPNDLGNTPSTLSGTLLGPLPAAKPVALTLWRDQGCADGPIHCLVDPASDTRELIHQAGLEAQRYRKIVEELPDIYYRTDREGRFVILNAAIEGFLGYRPEELIGKTVAELYVDPNIRERLLAEMQRQNGKIFGFENALRRKDGTTVWGMASSQFIYDTQGEIEGVEGIVKDITRLKSSESSLQLATRELDHQLRFLQTLIDTLPYPVFQTDANQRLLLWNAAFVDFCDSHPMTAGMPIQSALPPPLRDPVCRHLSGLVSETGRVTHEERIVTPGKQDRYLMLRKTSVPGHGSEIDGVVTVVTDISDIRNAEIHRQKLQASLHQAQKLETMGTLAGGIAHDFNNILAIIMGYCQMCQQLIPAGDPQQQELGDNLASILGASMRGKDIVTKLLTFSNSESCNVRTSIDVASALNEITTIATATFSSSIRIVQQLEAELPPITFGAADFQQVIFNALVNSRDAMEGQGMINLRAYRADPKEAIECHSCKNLFRGQYVVVEVADTGPGIPQTILPFLFDPFFSTKEIGKGTGLGLSVTHGLLHRVSGHVTVHCDEGCGAQMRFYLPVGTAPKTVQPASQDPTPNRRAPLVTPKQIGILFVDDEPSVTHVYAKLLELKGFRVVTENASTAALSRFVQDPQAFDLIITDQAMPDLTGLQLLQRMHKVRDPLPAILCTGNAGQIDQKSLDDFGNTLLLNKPISLDALLAAIHDVLPRFG